MKQGKVFLVGAGPGDVRLITVKGLEAIQQAEVILYDRLANPKLLESATDDCEFIYCGKLPDRHILRQEHINALLVEKALEGKFVVRLKGGDPGIFGRVGEEAQALAEHQIPFEIVPGISSGIAAPLYAGIPVTHRDFAESFAVVTAHDKSKEGKPLLDWEGLAHGVDTIAFYMGVGNLPFICENLIQVGKPADTPVILIQWGTFSRQKTLEGTLATIAEKAVKEQFSNPSIILVGNVISLRKKISWFEKKPLYGRQILLARTENTESLLAKELITQGADVFEFPRWRKTTLPMDPKMIGKLSTYEKIIFTSQESVNDFFETIQENRMDIRTITAELSGFSSKTIKALSEKGLIANLTEEIPESGNLLIVGNDSILKNNTAFKVFDQWVTSKKELDSRFSPIFERMLQEANVDTLIFPCRAAVQSFMDGFHECGLDPQAFLKSVSIIPMGEQTKRAVEALELLPIGMPENPTKEALLDYLIKSK